MMSGKSKGWAVTALLVCGHWGVALAQDYFDFGDIPGVPDEATVEIDLSPTLLGFAAGVTQQSDPDAAQMLSGLSGVRVRVYETLEDPAAVSDFMDDTSGRLERDGWERVVVVRDQDAKVRIYARMDGQQMNGMTIMVLDDSEAVFVNIAGRIDPEVLGRIAGNMGIIDHAGGALQYRDWRGGD